MLKKITQSAYLNLLSGLILLIASGYEIYATWNEVAFGAHHGVFIFSIIQLVKVIPEILHGLTEIQEGDEIIENKNNPLAKQ